MTVSELIEMLKGFNQEARISIGDNFDNELDIGWGGPETCTKENCDVVCFDVKGNCDSQLPTT